MYQYIDHINELETFIPKLKNAHTVFIDTEFLRRNTYYPILGLIQVNLDDGSDVSYVIDALDVDLKDFWHALFSVQLIVLHACSEDIDLIANEIVDLGITSPFPPIFDTQIGLAFLGHGLQVGYQDGLKTLLDIQIDKGESCSDWLARPLTKEQLDYAANDVIYLPKLFHSIKETLTQKTFTQGEVEYNLFDCALEDSASLCKDVLFMHSDEDVYKDSVDFRYTPKQLAQLQKLCCFREKTARTDNVPRTFIIKKSSLKDLLFKQPTDVKHLNSVKDMHFTTIKRYGHDILKCLTDLPSPDLYPKSGLRPFKEPLDSDLGATVQALITDLAEQLTVTNDIVMRKRWRTHIYEYVAMYGSDKAQLENHKQSLNRFVTGWRYEFVTQHLFDKLLPHYDILRSQIVPIEVTSQDGHAIAEG